ncbi:YHYH protein [Candidatus Gracilibacteria bacterium]|nr:YHYH protein [Candidatus Gracilibacteria bacterium]
MKIKILGILGLVLLTGMVTFAYTPSVSLQSKLDALVVKLEDKIDVEGESYRTNFLNTILKYKIKYSSHAGASYVLDYLHDELSHSHSDTTISSDYLDSYTIADSDYGTSVSVVVSGDSRTMKVNALPDHETGSFPNSGNPNTISAQSLTYSFPASGKYIGNKTWAQIPGVAVNGVKFEPETAERVECSSGETYKIEAIQDYTDLGLDFNNAHVQPTGEYHYHGSFAPLADNFIGEDLVHVGFAQDGFLIYYSKKSTYSPSYSLIDERREGSSCSYRNQTVNVDNTAPDGTYVSDWEYVAGSGDLDVCNGIEINGEYAYLITDEYPYIGRCLNGEYTHSKPSGGNGTQRAPTRGGPGSTRPPRR